MFDSQQFWGEGNPNAGATESQLNDVEIRLGFKLPQRLRQILKIHNGGDAVEHDLYFFATDHEYLPVIGPLAEALEDDEDLLEDMREEGFNANSLIAIGGGSDGHTLLALNKAECGADGTPQVLWIDSECFNFEVISPSFNNYTDDLTRVDEKPCFELSQIAGYTLVHESTLQFTYPDGIMQVVEQKLFDTGEAILLYLHDKFAEVEEYTLCEIRKPLDPDTATIEAYRPAPMQSWQLTLSPVEDEDQEEDRIFWLNSRRVSQGWKNSKNEGVPIHATFESQDKEELKKLRRTLLGGEPGERALAEEQWQETMDGMSDEDMEGLFPQMMMQMLQNSEQMVKDLDLGEPPPEIKDAFEHLAQLKEKLSHDLEARGENAPPLPPELAELMKQLFVNPDDDSTNSSSRKQ